jgi:hypothetical protein
MSIPLSAIIPAHPAPPRLPIYVALSELPPHDAWEPELRFEIHGIDLLIFWPDQTEPFSISLAPADLAAVTAGSAVWEEVSEAGTVQRSVPIVLSSAA